MDDNVSWSAAGTSYNGTWIPAEVTINGTLSVNEDYVNEQWAKSFLVGCRFWIHSVLLPIVVTIGVIGNLVTVIVLTRKRMKSSTNTYLTALAVSDFLFIVFNLILSWEHNEAYIREPQYLTYWHIYRWTIWLVDAASFCSNWLTVSFTLERYIAVKHPLKGKVMCTETRARKVIALVVILSCIFTSTTAFEWNVNVIDGKVGLHLTWLGEHPTYKSVFYWFSTIAVVVIPFASLSILNYLLVAAVRRSTKGRNQLTEDARGVRGSFRPNTPGNSIYSRCGSERSPNTHGMSQRRVFKERQENKVTIVLISVVFLFLICQAPGGITVIVKVFYEPKADTTGYYLLRSAGNICNFLLVINAASNFFLYCALSDTYQRTLAATFCRGRRRWQDRNDTLSTAASFRNSSVKHLRQEQEALTLC